MLTDKLHTGSGWVTVAVWMLVSAFVARADQPLLHNGSFEMAGLPQGWDLMGMGPSPVISHDNVVKKDGEYSIRIAAAEPTMAAVSQIVSVDPGRPYVLRGWVKTEDIKPDTAAQMVGTLVILPVGNEESSALVKAEEHRGTTDWTKAEVAFTAPASGEVYVFCSLIGQGSGTGTIWVDGLELVPGPAPASQAASAPASAPATTQPTESASSTASRLRNGSFEAAGAPEAWDVMVIGPTPAVSQDSAVVKEGHTSVRLVATEPTLAAVAQTVRVDPNRSYTLEGWVRTQDLQPAEKAEMLGTLVVLEAAESDSNRRLAIGPNSEGSNDWTAVKLEFSGPPGGRVHIFASLCGQGRAKGTVWFDDLRLTAGAMKPPASQPATQSAPAATVPAR